MMLLTTSVGIVEEVCSTGTVPPAGSLRRRAPRLAVHVVLADQRLGTDLAARVLAEVGEAGLGDLHLDHGLGRLALPLDHVEVAGHAGVHAADPEVAALGEAERVVELDLVGLAALLARGAGHQERGGADARATTIADEHAPHLGTALWDSSQPSRSRSSSREHVGAVRRGGLGGARAALELARGHRVRVQGVGERDEAAGGGAEGVEAAAGGREVVEPAEEVGGVGAREADLTGAAAQGRRPTPGKRRGSRPRRTRGRRARSCGASS